MKIGELAACAGGDAQTVRFCEHDGLLEAPPREPSDYRRHEARHVAQLNFVRHLRALGIPLHEVRQLPSLAAEPSGSSTQVKGLLGGHIAQVRQRIQARRAQKSQLAALCGEVLVLNSCAPRRENRQVLDAAGESGRR
jgi:DNA-binding transcriptional MerR regulator